MPVPRSVNVRTKCINQASLLSLAAGNSVVNSYICVKQKKWKIL
jgi:hypothetical protein